MRKKKWTGANHFIDGNDGETRESPEKICNKIVKLKEKYALSNHEITNLLFYGKKTHMMSNRSAFKCVCVCVGGVV